jgi:LPS export ABC transporter protein LptC
MNFTNGSKFLKTHKRLKYYISLADLQKKMNLCPQFNSPMSNRIVFLMLIVFTLFMYSCKNNVEQIKALENTEEIPDATVKDLVTDYSIGSRTQVELKTPLVYRYTTKKQYSLFPEGLNVKFFDRAGRLHSSLVADYAVYLDDKGFGKATGNVILTNINGSVLQTEELFIDEPNEKIYAVKSVNITDKDGFEITGKGGFESNLDFTVYRFKDVSGEKILKEGDNFFPENEENKGK